MGDKANSMQKTLTEELKEYDFDYIEPIERLKYSSYHWIRSNKDYMAKVFKKRDIFKHRLVKEALNREYAIADMIKKNFNFLLSFYDFFYTKSYAVLIYEYCKNGTLEELIEGSEPMASDEKKLIVRDVYQALEELKFLGILHRNVCPSIIYLTKYSIKLGGFDFCVENKHKVMDPADYRFFIDGVLSIESLAPETLFNEVITLKTPLYNFGVMIYRLFHGGEFHIEAKNIDELKHRYMNKDYQVSISKDLDNVRGRAKIKPVLFGLLRVNVKERMSFVDLREFISLIHRDLHKNEEDIRYNLLSRKHHDRGMSRRARIRKPSRARKLRPVKSLGAGLLKSSVNFYRHGESTSKFRKTLSKFGEDFMNKSMRLMDTFNQTDKEMIFQNKGMLPIIGPFQAQKKRNIGSLANLRAKSSNRTSKHHRVETVRNKRRRKVGEPLKLNKNQVFYSKKFMSGDEGYEGYIPMLSETTSINETVGGLKAPGSQRFLATGSKFGRKTNYGYRTFFGGFPKRVGFQEDKNNKEAHYFGSRRSILKRKYSKEKGKKKRSLRIRNKIII